MAGDNGAQHDFLGKFLGLRFHHHHGVGGAGDDEVQLGLFKVHLARVDEVFAILVADARCADRAHERGAGKDERRRGADHAEHVRIVFEIVGHSRQHNLDFMLEAGHEQRADRAVDEARGQRLFLGRAAFTLEVAARDAARCVVFFLIVDSQREEVLSGLGFLRKNGRREEDRVAIRHHNGAIGLAGHLARFNRQRAAGPFQRHGLLIKHFVLSFFTYEKPAAALLPGGLVLGRPSGECPVRR